MADEFDPLKKPVTQAYEDVYDDLADVRKNLTGDDDLLRPTGEQSSRTHQSAYINTTGQPTPEQGASNQIYNTLDFISKAAKAPVRPTDASVETAHSTAEATLNTHHTDGASTGYYGREIGTGPPPAHYEEPNDYDATDQKRRGIGAAVFRLVQRFPGIGLFFRPSPEAVAEAYEPEQEPEYAEEAEEEEEEVGDEAPQLVDAEQVARELTDDETALIARYSDRLRTQTIRLQVKDETQPVDVGIHRESSTLYLCDIGRSVVEVFNLSGELEHVINDPTTAKFQPTAITIADDGTVIVASHFHHRLHLYSPIDAANVELADQTGSEGDLNDGYCYQQFKLGSPGHNLHQFHHPAGIDIDSNDGYLYVCDRGNFRVKVMRPEGVCERVIELVVPGDEPYHVAPIQVAHQHNGDQLVCIVGSGDAICFLAKNGDGATDVEPLYILDNDGLGIQGGSGIVLDAQDRIFISDTGHHRIVICTAEGSYIAHFGTEGDQADQLKLPCGLAITSDGTLVVADSGNKRLQLFGTSHDQAVSEENKESLETPSSATIRM